MHFSEEIDAFEALVDDTLAIVNAGIVTRLEEPFREMKKTDWTRVESIGDESAYIKHIKEVLGDTVGRLRRHVPAERFLLVCRKLSERILEGIKVRVCACVCVCV